MENDKVVNLFETKEEKRDRRMDELGFNIFDKATCRINNWDPDEFKRIQNKFLRHADSLDW